MKRCAQHLLNHTNYPQKVFCPYPTSFPQFSLKKSLNLTGQELIKMNGNQA